MNLAAIYHRATDNMCYCLNENDIVISIKTDYDVEKITLFHGDPFSEGIMGGDHEFKGTGLVMTSKLLLKNHILWTAKVSPEYKRLTYYFLIENKDESYYLLEDGFYTPEEYKNYKERRQTFYFPWMNPSDIVTPPAWVKNTVWYQIFIDRFCNGDTSYNPSDVKPWAGPSEKVSYKDFYGGDIPGITSKLDYLKDLGVTGIYLTPVCKGTSNHKYDTTEYTEIDPHFGNDDDMKKLVKESHSRGIRVMMDGVFNHSGPFFKPWYDVVKKGPESKYYDWFMINSWPFEIPELKEGVDFSKNTRSRKYYAFAFADPMPKLNTNNPKVIEYVLNVVKKWITEYDIDALRLDVANEISHTLAKAICKMTKNINPDFFILGEIWHDSITWLRGDEYDSVMNYPFGDSINTFWSNKNTTALDFEHSINRCYSMYAAQTNEVLFNLLDSHDTIRLITKLGDENAFYQQMAVLFTMPGSVCIYYGTEILLEGSYDPDCRRCMPWENIQKGIYDERINKMKQLISMRKQNSALTGSEYSFIHENYSRIIHYTRDNIHVIINCSTESFSIRNNDSSGCWDIIFSNLFEHNHILPGGVIICK